MTQHSPIVIVIGGPNGAGKSTIAPAIIDRVFADTIARGLSGLDPDRQAFAAGRIMLRHISELATARRAFAFESTLASRTFAPFLRRLVRDGYKVHLLYVWVRSPEIAIERVRARVNSGGHSVAEEVIRRRFDRSVRNLFRHYLPLANTWEVFDNSESGKPSNVASGGEGIDEHMIIRNSHAWSMLEQFDDG